MTTYTHDDLKVILALHFKWLCGEKDGMRADLRSADLRSADLSGANLRSANLRSADLSGANLRSANLRSADLRSADLRSANLRSADLRSADLRSADLSGANLRSADLSGANLRSADLSGAVLSDGITFGQFIEEVVPALLVAGGKDLAAIATPGNWACHSWTNCPMALAFDVHSLNDVPAIHRFNVDRFVQFYDAGLVPLPTIPKQDAA